MRRILHTSLSHVYTCTMYFSSQVSNILSPIFYLPSAPKQFLMSFPSQTCNPVVFILLSSAFLHTALKPALRWKDKVCESEERETAKRKAKQSCDGKFLVTGTMCPVCEVHYITLTFAYGNIKMGEKVISLYTKVSKICP